MAEYVIRMHEQWFFGLTEQRPNYDCVTSTKHKLA